MRGTSSVLARVHYHCSWCASLILHILTNTEYARWYCTYQFIQGVNAGFSWLVAIPWAKGIFTWSRGSELPQVNDCPGASVHVIICCPGATLPRVNLIVPGQVQCHLITTNWSELLKRMNFKHAFLFLYFLKLFTVKFILTLLVSMCKTTLAPGQLLRFVHTERSYLGKTGYPVLYNG